MICEDEKSVNWNGSTDFHNLMTCVCTFELAVSNIVSTSSTSAPPSRSALACSAYASTRSSNAKNIYSECPWIYTSISNRTVFNKFYIKCFFWKFLSSFEIFTAPQRSCGKVMLSQVFVCPRGCVYDVTSCLATWCHIPSGGGVCLLDGGSTYWRGLPIRGLSTLLSTDI